MESYGNVNGITHDNYQTREKCDSCGLRHGDSFKGWRFTNGNLECPKCAEKSRQNLIDIMRGVVQ